MVRLAHFNLHMGGERGGHAQPGAEHYEDQRVARFHQFHAAAETDAQRFETLHFLVVGFNVADDRTNARRELIQPDKGNGGLA